MDSTAAEPSSLPWDTTVGNRFAHYSSTNHSAPVWIAAALGLTYVVGVLLIRVFIKWRVFGWDDILILISTVGTLYNTASSLLTIAGICIFTDLCIIQSAPKWSRQSIRRC
jgi:hypothetical protein